MTNLWEETIKIIEHYDKTWDDVQIIYGEKFQITKDNFEKVAKETNYDSGYGSQKIAKDLVIIGTGFAMSRKEYDGSEWWNFLYTGFDIPKEFKEIKHLGGGYWDNLSELNKEKKELK